MAKIDIIVPLYNEAEGIGIFHARLVQILEAMPFTHSIIYVDDGSVDNTLPILLELARGNSHITVVQLSRNFGHQSALAAGLSIAQGDYTIMMDGDGQHPPELIPKMLELAQQGFDIVQTSRLEQPKLGWIKRTSSKLFYKLVNFIGSTKIEPSGADFCLISRPVLEGLRRMPEYHLFLRGMIAWAGFPTTVLPYQPLHRIAGTSKYSPRKMLHLAADAIFSFSLVPLYFSIIIGLCFLCLALAEIVYALTFWFRGLTDQLAPGWASLMFMLLLLGGVLLITLGIIGIYIGYIFQEVKHRPVFLIKEIHTSNQPENT
jgi:glycosyltransferase involved in cell wall biosynthesis